MSEMSTRRRAEDVGESSSTEASPSFSSSSGSMSSSLTAPRFRRLALGCFFRSSTLGSSRRREIEGS